MWGIPISTSLCRPREGERITLLVVDPQQLAAQAGVAALGDPLRQLDEPGAKPLGQRPVTAPETPGERHGPLPEDVLNEFILERNDRLAAAGIALAAATAELLPVDSSVVVALGGQHMEATNI